MDSTLNQTLNILNVHVVGTKDERKNAVGLFTDKCDYNFISENLRKEICSEEDVIPAPAGINMEFKSLKRSQAAKNFVAVTLVKGNYLVPEFFYVLDTLPHQADILFGRCWINCFAHATDPLSLDETKCKAHYHVGNVHEVLTKFLERRKDAITSHQDDIPPP